jgi:hypothetical protein
MATVLLALFDAGCSWTAVVGAKYRPHPKHELKQKLTYIKKSKFKFGNTLRYFYSAVAIVLQLCHSITIM